MDVIRLSNMVFYAYHGVEEGELVVTLGPETLSDGQPVKVVTR